LGLETEFARETRSRLKSTPGVLAVKGCGAGLNDCFIVVLDRNLESQDQGELTNRSNELNLKDLGSLKDLLW